MKKTCKLCIKTMKIEESFFFGLEPYESNWMVSLPRGELLYAHFVILMKI